MNSSSPSKFDMRINPVYQVDWQNAASGKRVSATKRRVRFRFGFSDKEALEIGLTGTACRGEEHDVTLVWSVASGKRLITADGQEVHFSKGARTENKFHFSWAMQGGHIITLIAYAAPPLFLTPGFRQFDLLLDGCSYFDMPKIYELGTKRGSQAVSRALAVVPRGGEGDSYQNYSFARPVTPASRGGGDGDNHGSRSYDDSSGGNDAHRSTHSLASTDSRKALPGSRSSPPRRTESAPPVVDLLSDDGEQDYLAGPVSTPAPSQQPFPAADAFAPVEATPTEAFYAASNQIMSQYGPAPTSSAIAPMALANESHTHYVVPPTPTSTAHQQPQQQMCQQYTPPPQQVTPQSGYFQQQTQAQFASPSQAQQPQPITPDTSSGATGTADEREQPPSSPVVQLSMEPLSLRDLDAKPEMSEHERAIHALVNLDDLTEAVTTPEQQKAQEKKAQNQPSKSRPLPPTAADWHLGMNPKLGDIKEHAPPKSQPAKEIMRTHAFDPAAVHAGMMVVYGATSSLPQQQQMGFGAGVHPSHYQYQHQQYAQSQQYYGYQQQHQQQVYTAY